jgi:hypothetical protein
MAMSISIDSQSQSDRIAVAFTGVAMIVILCLIALFGPFSFKSAFAADVTSAFAVTAVSAPHTEPV